MNYQEKPDTCRECVHYEVCEDDVELHHDFYDCLEVDGVEKHCEYFKPKSRFVELPCEVGQTVYCIPFKNHIYEGTVAQVAIERIKGKVMLGFLCYGGMCFDSRDFGKTVFLTKEEAEKALKERENE